MGANPVQVEIEDFDEAIEVFEDEAAESKFTRTVLICLISTLLYP